MMFILQGNRLLTHFLEYISVIKRHMIVLFIVDAFVRSHIGGRQIANYKHTVTESTRHKCGCAEFPASSAWPGTSVGPYNIFQTKQKPNKTIEDHMCNISSGTGIHKLNVCLSSDVFVFNFIYMYATGVLVFTGRKQQTSYVCGGGSLPTAAWLVKTVQYISIEMSPWKYVCNTQIIIAIDLRARCDSKSVLKSCYRSSTPFYVLLTSATTCIHIHRERSYSGRRSST